LVTVFEDVHHTLTGISWAQI